MEDFIFYLLKSAGLLTAFFLFYLLLLKKDTGFITNRKFLLAGIITSAILPAVYFTKTVIIKAQPIQSQWAEDSSLLSQFQVQESIVSPFEIFAGLYFLGVIMMTIRLLLQLHSLSKVILSGKLSGNTNGKFIETSLRIAPFSFLNYVVYNPGLHTKTELEFILKHETAHVKQGHTLDVLLANLNLIYQWFNPFAWLYLKSIQQNLEFIADREAVKKAGCKKEYQKALVKISVENFNLALTNNFYQSLIKKRIIMLNRAGTNKSSSWKTLLMFPALLGFIFVFNIKTVAQIVTVEQEKETPYEISGDFEISLEIKNTSNKEQLDHYSKLLQKYNVNLQFENITRNGDGLITGISANFLDKNNNSSGSISRQSEDGIKGFIFYYNEKQGSGFRNPKAGAEGGNHNLLRNLGTEPLIIVDGKQFSISALEGKAIKIMGDVSSLNAEKAIKTYGNAGKNGAIIIIKGEIIDDLNDEFKKVDAQGQNTVRDYIKFEQGKPMLINLNKNVSGKATGTASRGTKDRLHLTRQNPPVNLKELSIQGKNPIYIVNGEVLGKNSIIDTIDPARIAGINVLKGYSATAIYGNDAKEGAIIITTKKQQDSTKSKKFNFTTTKSGRLDSIKFDRTYIYDGASFLEDGNSGRIRTFNAGGKTFYPQVTGNENEVGFIRIDGKSVKPDKPLVIVDGKEMPEDFEMSSIDNEDYERVIVTKGATAIEKYGKKAKGGSIEVTTKKQAKTATLNKENFEIVNASSTDKELNTAKNRIKNKTGIDVEFKNVKRNRDGMIRSIQVVAKHQGESVTLNVSETSGISDLYIGNINNKIRVMTVP